MKNTKTEYGDFQTPRCLADAVVSFLQRTGITPSVLVEPTCGLGSFVLAGITAFDSIRQVFAYDVNPDYVSALQRDLREVTRMRCHVVQQDFFTFGWKKFFAGLQGEVLVLGNPPWVTNAALGALGSDNLPTKTNFQNHTGFAAKTGKANFDISEWMLIRLIEGLDDRDGCVTMLCKTATARKVLFHAWRNHLDIGRATIHPIDASSHFGASVDACLLVVHTGVREPSPIAGVFSDLSFDNKLSTFGLIGKTLVADIDEYNRVRDLDGLAYHKWRSGVKHDAASVMELRKEGAGFVNGLGEHVDLEETYIYPLLKSSDLANGRLAPKRYVMVTQSRPGDETESIEWTAPKTWAYLLHHADMLDRRRSIIYQKRARFSVFGVGDYTFSPWKVAISGLYKNCRFEVVSTYRGKPVVLDDTCYSIPCNSQEEADFVRLLLNSDVAKQFLHSLIFFDAKRPVTIDVLNRMDLSRVAERLGLEDKARKYLQEASLFEGGQSVLVFEKAPKYKAKTSGRRAVQQRRRCRASDKR